LFFFFLIEEIKDVCSVTSRTAYEKIYIILFKYSTLNDTAHIFY